MKISIGSSIIRLVRSATSRSWMFMQICIFIDVIERMEFEQKIISSIKNRQKYYSSQPESIILELIR